MRGGWREEGGGWRGEGGEGGEERGGEGRNDREKWGGVAI